MVRNIRRENIDIVLMLTKCSETYCYSLYDSIMGGAIIYALSNTGNVEYTVKNEKLGRIFNSVDELKKHLNNITEVEKDILAVKYNNKYWNRDALSNPEILKQINMK